MKPKEKAIFHSTHSLYVVVPHFKYLVGVMRASGGGLAGVRRASGGRHARSMAVM